MSHTVGVVGHISRAEMVDYLADRVRPEVVSIDDGALGCEGNHRAVWRQLAANYPHSHWTVVLEDDALPVDDFDCQLEAALKVSPSPVVSLYLGRMRPPQYQSAISARVAADQDAHWFVGNRLLHAVGVAVRTGLVDAMLTYTSLPHACRLPIDEAISRWVIAQGMSVAYTWPSLVDHADEPTVIARHRDGAPRPPGRVAWRTGQRATWCGHAAALALR
ncbi:hypothetical protein [Mycobacterium sp. 1245801.1]|uniref:hypothetical protein n=1 Tax=Mycobacterium sp. 1245801.1 TaxID=1834075 RepID=UPI0009F5FAEE|nr:hypothetical protein [Mycobacterium sp. 1245801.1]